MCVCVSQCGVKAGDPLGDLMFVFLIVRVLSDGSLLLLMALCSPFLPPQKTPLLVV